MKILSALEDFVGSTLSSLPNKTARLQFVSKMKTPEGYVHWGLAKLYGKDAAQSAVAEAHSQIFEEVLTTPINELAETEFPLPEQPLEDTENLLPENLRGGSQRHLKWTLRVLHLLRRQRS